MNIKNKEIMQSAVALLKRKVFEQGGKIVVETEEIEGCVYAFYLHTDRDIEKKFYSSESTRAFTTVPQTGFYWVTFFYKFEHFTILETVEFNVKIQTTVRTLKSTVIVEEESYKIVNYDVGSAITFVVFQGTGSTKNSPAFGLNFLMGQGFNIIACFQDNDSQYQELSFETFREYVKPLIQNKTVFTYGSSLGAYCAVYYAGAINATAIASAPRNSAHPSISKEGGMFYGRLFKHKEIKDNKLSQKPIYIIYDPFYDVDVNFIEKQILPGYPQAKLVPVDYGGHEVLYYLQDTKQLASLITSIVQSKEVHIDVNINSKYLMKQKAIYSLLSQRYGESIAYVQQALTYPWDDRNKESLERVLNKAQLGRSNCTDLV